jgi:glyoxylase I family protein
MLTDMFRKIDHVEIVTREPERSAKFYVEVLGFTERLRQQVPMSRDGSGGILDIVYLDLGGTGIELLTYRGVPVAEAPEGIQLGYRLMALEVDDMKATLEQLAAKGIGASWGPVRVASYTRAEIRDPDGYSVELREWHVPLPGRGR